MRWVIDSTDAASIVDTRRAVASHVRAESHGNADDFMVELLTGEILAAEWYRHGGAIAVEVEWENGDAVLDVWDQGPPLDLEQTVNVLDQPVNLVLRKFAAELQIERTPQGNHIRVHLPARRDTGSVKGRRLWEIAATLVGLRSEQIADRFHRVIRDDDPPTKK